MELIKTADKSGVYFKQYEFILVDQEISKDEIVCFLMAMEIERKKLDLTVATVSKYARKGYGTEGLKMMIRWAKENGYETVTMTNVFNSRIIEKIAKKLNFQKENEITWSKKISGPINI